MIDEHSAVHSTLEYFDGTRDKNTEANFIYRIRRNHFRCNFKGLWEKFRQYITQGNIYAYFPLCDTLQSSFKILIYIIYEYVNM